ncbi:peptidase C14 [Lenzites betulinus]|nr:peptidase C14 [Lenzites betulinus]
MPVLTSGPRRKALLIGVREVPQMFEVPVPGAHMDTKLFRKLLYEKYDYSWDDIVILKDDTRMSEEDRAQFWPTRANIIREMEDLVRNAQSGDRFVFMYSGHGGQVHAVADKYEKDEKDEVLFACDSLASEDNSEYLNCIIDDEIRATFMRLPAGASCVMVFDCCHSGTAADLPDVTDDDDESQPSPVVAVRSPSISEHKNFSGLPNKHIPESGGSTKITAKSSKNESSATSYDPSKEPNLTSWSACKDGDNTIGNSKGGTFVRAFVQALTKDPKPLHVKLLHELPGEIQCVLDKAPREYTQDVETPIPQLGSLRHHGILNMPFTL